jgi:hypothetical protein
VLSLGNYGKERFNYSQAEKDQYLYTAFSQSNDAYHTVSAHSNSSIRSFLNQYF